jgi:alpha-galactosidase
VIKVAMIGAGSVVFCKNLTGDILWFPGFRDATFSYMDIDPDRLEVGAALCRKAAKALGANPRIEATTDRRRALAGADFVINMVQVGGFDATLIDFEIPRKYGLNFTIADTTGPGGLFRALRTFPVLRGLCRDMEAVCPSAVLLNYANPMSMNMQTVTRTSGVRAVGLCHSVQGTLNQLADYVGEKPDDVAFVCAGINHMAFYLRLEDRAGNDLYPRLFQAMCRPDVYHSNRVRFELMKRLGYFVTESSEHNAEYNPWFIPHGPQRVHEFAVPIDEYLRRCDTIVEEFDRLKQSSRTSEATEVRRSCEYGSTIVHSMATGEPAVVYGNMPNRGAISNLPPDAIVEVATLVDRAGLRPTTVGALPPQLVAYMNPHVGQHELFIRAALEGRRDHVYQAAMFDPLTAATLPPDRVVEMCDELIAAHGTEMDGGSLPDLDAKRTLVPTSGKIYPRANAKELRAAWEARQRHLHECFITDWLVIGPFPSEPAKRNGLDVQTPIESELALRDDGSIDRKATYRVGERSLRWSSIRADRRGFVDLGAALGRQDWAIAYAYAEVDSAQEREATVRCGSDDGIKLWLNGTLAYFNEVARAYCPGGDAVPVRLKTGVNRILVKVDNYTAGWGFGVAVLPEA